MCSLRERMCSLTCVGVGDNERPIASIGPMLTMVPHGVILCIACVCVCEWLWVPQKFVSFSPPPLPTLPSISPSIHPSRSLALSLSRSLARARALSLSLSVCGVCVPQIGRFAVARAREVSRLC
jgi:hypothetical protein